jgi:hypothetical protein
MLYLFATENNNLANNQVWKDLEGNLHRGCQVFQDQDQGDNRADLVFVAVVWEFSGIVH